LDPYGGPNFRQGDWTAHNDTVLGICLDTMYISQSRSLIFASPRAFISNARAASHLQGGEATILGSNHFFDHVGAILNLRS